MSVTIPTMAEFEALKARVSALERGTSGAEMGVIAEAARLPCFVRRGDVHTQGRPNPFGLGETPTVHLWRPCPDAEATARAVPEGAEPRWAAQHEYVRIVPLGAGAPPVYCPVDSKLCDCGAGIGSDCRPRTGPRQPVVTLDAETLLALVDEVARRARGDGRR